jgi:hypothetical protein
MPGVAVFRCVARLSSAPSPMRGKAFTFLAGWNGNSPGFGDFLCFVISEIRMSGVAVLRFRFSLPFAIRGRSLLGIIRIIGE